MGFFKKRQEDLAEIRSLLADKNAQLQTRLDQVPEGIEKLGNVLEYNTLELHKHTEKLEKHMAELQKHNMALEDTLDMLQEREEKESLQEKRIGELEQAEGALLELLSCYQGQMRLIGRYMEENPETGSAWQNQLRLMEEEVEKRMAACGLEELTGCGKRVDYETHEVVEAVETDREELALTVAKVYSSGYSYKGHVKKKAEVAAYRLRRQ